MSALADVKPIPVEAQAGFELRLVGPVLFVRPEAAYANGWHDRRLRWARTLAGRGRIAEAATVIHQLQRALGVSQEMHIEAVEIAEAARLAGMGAIGRANRARVKAERKRVAGLVEVDEALPYTATQKKAIRRAEAWRTQAEELISRAELHEQPAPNPNRDFKRARLLRQDARVLRNKAEAALAEIEEAHAQRLDVRDVAAAINERRSLEAERRGEAVEIEDVDEACDLVRLSGYDGLEAMKWKPSESSLKSAGYRYRDLYVSCQAGWGSTIRAGAVKVDGGKDNVRQRIGEGGELAVTSTELTVMRMAQRRRIVTDLHLKVRPLGQLHLDVLIAVAGEGQTIREFVGQGGRKSATASAALRLALQRLADIFAKAG